MPNPGAVSARPSMESKLSQPQETFSTPNHPSYSSFSHIETVDNLTFAVGLREDEDELEETIRKIIPMAKPKKGPPIKKQAFVPAPTMTEDCDNPECLARQDKYRELQEANNNLKETLHSLDSDLKLKHTKFQHLEKHNKKTEDENDKLQEQLDEIRSRTNILEEEKNIVQKDTDANRSRLAEKRSQIAQLREDVERYRREIEEAEANAGSTVIFAPRPRTVGPETRLESTAVQMLQDAFSDSSHGSRDFASVPTNRTARLSSRSEIRSAGKPRARAQSRSTTQF